MLTSELPISVRRRILQIENPNLETRCCEYLQAPEEISNILDHDRLNSLVLTDGISENEATTDEFILVYEKFVGVRCFLYLYFCLKFKSKINLSSIIAFHKFQFNF